METELPKISTISEFTPETFKQYVEYVNVMRHNQKRWFSSHKPDALEISKKMEKELDAFNGRLLNPVPSLFD